MALTYTPPAGIGSKMPSFDLPNVLGGKFSSNDFKISKARVVMFICNHCPYVQAIEDRLIELGQKQSPDIQMVAICANDSSDYPEDAPQALAARAVEKNYPFPYLFDETQTVAKAFGAVCTPDFFVFDQNNQLTYRGRLDDSWKNPAKVQHPELSAAIESTRLGKGGPAAQHPSMGCSIKWKN